MEIYCVLSNDINMTKRLDFNFWQPNKVSFSNSVELKTLEEWYSGEKFLATSAFYPSITPYYLEKKDGKGIPFIRVADTRKLLLDYDSTVFLEKDILGPLKKSIARVFPGDILITKGGEYIGEAALVPNYYEEYAICRDVLAIKQSDKAVFTSKYLTAFLRSKYGHNEILKTRSVQGQPHLTLDKIKSIKVPYYGEDFDNEIQMLYNSFFTLINASDEHLQKAKNILNEFLDESLETVEDLDSFSINLTPNDLAKRCDFNYYENKWSKLVDSLKKNGHSFRKINFVKEKLSSGLQTDLYKYITLSDIDDRSGTITNYRNLKRFELPDRANRMVLPGDVLVSSLKGSKNKIAIVYEQYENIVASTGFYIVRDEGYSPEVLYLFFRSNYYDLFIEQMASGSIMSSITEKYFKKFEIPEIPEIIQDEITTEIKLYLEKREFAFRDFEEASQRFDGMFVKREDN